MIKNDSFDFEKALKINSKIMDFEIHQGNLKIVALIEEKEIKIKYIEISNLTGISYSSVKRFFSGKKQRRLEINQMEEYLYLFADNKNDVILFLRLGGFFNKFDYSILKIMTDMDCIFYIEQNLKYESIQSRYIKRKQL